MPDYDKMAGEVVAAAQAFVTRSLAGMTERINGLEQRIAEIPAGQQGPQGVPGRDGIDGKGLQGDPGIAGKDGAPGERGEAGMGGKDGIPGAIGEKGERGDAGIIGERGEKGIDGREGKDGRDGRDGEPGKDAIEIRIVDLDTTRSYPRGTYAVHEGSFLRAERATGPVTDGLTAAGWKVLSDGIAETAIELAEDMRTIKVVAIHASGKKTERSIVLPVLLDKGVWRHAVKYLRGDCVTRDGSLWIAQQDSENTPGESSDWRLAVKRGRDGKDGKDASTPTVVSLGTNKK